MRPSVEFPSQMVLDQFESASGREIPNCQEHTVMSVAEQAARWESFRRMYKGATPRTSKATGIYNCHGLVFAASRTGIDHGREVRKILHDDGYVKISPPNSLPGDVVLYVSDNGDVEHSAILVTPEHLSRSTHAVVVSKWGAFTEWVHDIPLCPYQSTNIEYWRIDEKPRSTIEIAQCLP